MKTLWVLLVAAVGLSAVAGTSDAVELKLKDHYFGVAPFRPAGNAFSAAVHVKVECPYSQDRRQRLLMSVGNGWNHGFRLCLMPDCTKGAFRPFIEIGRGAGRRAWALDAVDSPPVVPGRWYRLAATWDGTTGRLYLDGREVAHGAHADAYAPEASGVVRTGIDGESYGIASVPFLLNRAAVWTRALSADEVRAFSPGDPFEPDTPGFADFMTRYTRGFALSTAETTSWKAAAHSPKAALALACAETLALLAEKRHDEAVRLRDATIARMEKHPYDRRLVGDFRSRFREGVMRNGPLSDVLAIEKDEYAQARAAGVGHLPYVALSLLRTAERAGDAACAAQTRAELARMDLRRFPQVAAELGLAAEFTAHAEKGASVSRAMPTRAIHVSPAGDDAADGSAAHPLKTLAAARDAVRALRRRGGLPTGGVAVRLHGGVYSVDGTLGLTAEDSGEPAKPVVWCAAEGETPILDGGFAVPAFGPVSDPDARARLPEAARGKVLCADLRAAGFADPGELSQYGYYANLDYNAVETPPAVMELYQEDERLPPARYPNTGWLRIEPPDPGADSNRCAKISLPDWETWARERDLGATGFWNNFWADLSAPVTNVDAKTHTIWPNLVTKYRRGPTPREGQTCYLFNALCALDEPGEWCYERATGRLYVWPRADRAPRFTLGRFDGVFIDARGVHDLRIEGLVFRHGRGTAVAWTDCTECVFAGNAVVRFGGMGMLARNCPRTTISENVFRTFGHGALALSGGVRRTLEHAESRVLNNDFAQVELRRRTYAPHLHLAGVGIEVAYNHFSDSPSSAMRLEGNDFLIVSNLVENVLLESDDQGGVDIYYNASYFGNRYCFNVWKGIGRHSDTIPCGQAAVRFDGNISGQTVYGNRFVDCGTGNFGAVQSCGGRLHVIDNNLFVRCNRGMSITHYPTHYWFGKIRQSLLGVCLRDVCITNAPYATRYPGIADLLYTNQVSHLVRNVTVGDVQLLVNPPPDTVAYGNWHFPEMPDLGKLAREGRWRPIPEERDVGPRDTPLFRRASANARRALK